MRQGQRQVVAAGFGEHVADGPGQVQHVVRLVDVRRAVPAVGFGEGGAGGGGLPHRREHERAHQLGGVLTQLALGQPGDEDPAVQDPAHVEAGLGDAEGGADEVAQQERA